MDIVNRKRIILSCLCEQSPNSCILITTSIFMCVTRMVVFLRRKLQFIHS